METIAIVGLVSLLGYSFANKEEIRDIKENDPTRSITKMPDEERPVSTNIYNNTMYEEAEDKTLGLSIDNSIKAENPLLTGVLPPIYNSYSGIGNESLLSNSIVDGSVKTLSDINNINRYKDVTGIVNNEPSLTSRPMFKALLNLDTTSSNDFSNNFSNDFSNFGQGTPTNETISLLTGLPVEREHNNLVPFFGSNVKQNVESFTNTSTLDKYMGNTSTFIHKNEQGPFFDSYQQDIYGTPHLTNVIDTDRYIPSVFRQNEKPFEPERIAAPISGTLNNPVTIASGNFRTVDQLRTANKPQISYEARTVAGQYGNVRGVYGNVSKNKVDTHFELGKDRLFTSTGLVIGKKADENFSNLQDTSRQDQNIEYYGIALNKEGLKSEPRYAPNAESLKYLAEQSTSFDNSDELGLIVSTADDSRQQLASDTVRNLHKTTINNHDYGKSSINLQELERNSTNVQHILNVNKVDSSIIVGLQDTAKSTIKETTLDNTRAASGNINSFINKGDSTAYENGLIGVDLRTTQKESTLFEHRGQANKKDQTGYNIANYFAKTTHKETTSDNNYNGHVASKNKSSTVYSTYANPEKVRNPSMAVNYQGNASYEIGQAENRNKYKNATVNENSTRLVSNQRPGGQNHQNYSGGVEVVGNIYTKPNKFLAEEAFTFNPNISNISNVIPTKSKIGTTENWGNEGNSRGGNVYGEVENKRETREFASLINDQLKDNPYYNLKRI